MFTQAKNRCDLLKHTDPISRITLGSVCSLKIVLSAGFEAVSCRKVDQTFRKSLLQATGPVHELWWSGQSRTTKTLTGSNRCGLQVHVRLKQVQTFQDRDDSLRTAGSHSGPTCFRLQSSLCMYMSDYCPVCVFVFVKFSLCSAPRTLLFVIK